MTDDPETHAPIASDDRGESAEPRWLTSRLFWPLYLTLVALFLGVFRPWDAWLLSSMTIPEPLPSATVIIHRGAESTFEYFAAGSVLLFAGSLDDAPEDWLPCDGRELQVAEHGDLYRRLGGRPEEALPDQVFAIPDYRGLYADIGVYRPNASLPWLEASDSDDFTPEGLRLEPVHFLIKAKPTTFTIDDTGKPVEEKR